MRKIITLATCLLCFATSNTMAQAGNDANNSPEMKAWMDYMTPGKVHEMLAKSNGKWKTETTMWMAPNTDPMKSEGTCENTMILGGRYQQSTFHGNMMNMPFEGISTLAYDNAKKKFISNWIDNMGTGMTTMEGTWDDASKSITFTGTEMDPSSGKDMPIRQVFKVIDDNNQIMDMYTNANGQDFKMLEVKLTRM